MRIYRYPSGARQSFASSQTGRITVNPRTMFAHGQSRHPPLRICLCLDKCEFCLPTIKTQVTPSGITYQTWSCKCVPPSTKVRSDSTQKHAEQRCTRIFSNYVEDKTLAELWQYIQLCTLFTLQFDRQSNFLCKWGTVGMLHRSLRAFASFSLVSFCCVRNDKSAAL